MCCLRAGWLARECVFVVCWLTNLCESIGARVAFIDQMHIYDGGAGESNAAAEISALPAKTLAPHQGGVFYRKRNRKQHNGMHMYAA